MSNRTFMVIVAIVLLLVGAAVVMHTPAGAGLRRTLRSLHGGD